MIMLKYIFTRKFNLFDVVTITLIGTLAATHVAWFLALIPAIFFSAYMETRYGKS